MSTTLNLGRIMPINRGSYAGSTSYGVLDVVEHNGSSYWCKAACQGVEPPNASYWVLMASKGADGTNGQDGSDGIDAYQPFKGWFDSSSALSTNFPSPAVGDYAYVVGATSSDPVSVYKCSVAGTWADSGSEFNPANNQSFQTGQDLDQTKIINDPTTGGANHVLSAEAGKTINAKVDALGPEIFQPIDGEVETLHKITGDGEYETATGANNRTLVADVSDYVGETLRLSGRLYTGSSYCWWAFHDASGNVLTKSDVGGESSVNFENVAVVVPSGAKTLYVQGNDLVMPSATCSEIAITKKHNHELFGGNKALTASETIGSKYIYKSGVLTSGGSSFSVAKFDISNISGILSLKSNASDHTSVYCYAIHDANGTSLSNPSDSQNITVKREFEIDLDSLTGYKWLYVAYPVAYVKNTIKGKLEEIDEDIAALQSSVQSVSTEVENTKKATMVMQSKAYADSIKKNLMLNLTYNTFVVASDGGAFFPIQKGQSVEVTANSTTATNYALLDTLPEQVEGTPADYMTGETGHTLAAGETTNFTSPSNGYLYVRNSLWGTASFPSSLKIGTPVADEINSITDTVEKNMLFEPGLTFRMKDLDKIAEGTTTDGIFDDTSRTNYLTSDYIEIDPYVVNPYCVFLETLSSSFKLMEFYDENKGLLKTIMGTGPTGNFADFNRRILKVHFPNGCKYVRYARYKTYTTLGLYKAKVVNMETILSEYESHSVFTENNNILWLGTSIPEGATYPAQASAKCGYNCTNRSHGSSSLCALAAHPTTLNYASGRRLTMTQAEIEAMFRQDVTSGDITEDKLTEWKNDSYEVRVLPYINGTNATQVSMIVIDHGFNDRYKIHAQMQDVENIDWSSDDRTTFTGAFRFLLDEITKCNPFIKVVIAGYFQNTYMHTDYYADEICRMQELIAEHYSISIMKAWEHTQINNKFVAGTNGYFTAYNAEYGTSISPYAVDSNGNILSMQLYCPDMTHPPNLFGL